MADDIGFLSVRRSGPYNDVQTLTHFVTTQCSLRQVNHKTLCYHFPLCLDRYLKVVSFPYDLKQSRTVADSLWNVASGRRCSIQIIWKQQLEAFAVVCEEWSPWSEGSNSMVGADRADHSSHTTAVASDCCFHRICIEHNDSYHYDNC